MKVVQVNKTNAFVELDESELLALNNALNEVCYGLRTSDFHPRIGVDQPFVQKLLYQIGDMLDSMNVDSNDLSDSASPRIHR